MTAEQRSVQRALARGATEAARSGTRIDAAVWETGWSRPAAVNGARRLRWWSMAKPVTALAALQAAAQAGTPVSTTVRDAMTRAIRRSENCRQRRVVLELQRAAGGLMQARRNLMAVFAHLGQSDGYDVARHAQPSAPICVAYLRANAAGIASPTGSALLLGTSHWTPVVAAAFARGLAEGSFGSAGEDVLRLMRQPKQPSTEQPRSDYTAALDWGAGRAFRGWAPAYKAGWGGAADGRFMAGQIVALRRAGHAYGVAVMASPGQQPAIDDPGLTSAPNAVELVLRRVRAAIS